MGNIKLLSEEISQLIAAGEVVDRPVSIVKELVENSIDAFSTQIKIEIKNGGKTLIKVSDNGQGFLKEDIQIAFLRHATSKIKTKEDLDKIITLGFRGEALASISSVSNVKLITKRKEDNLGFKYIISFGKEISLEEVGTYNGTVFEITDLFLNIPARMKFLKKDISESNAIQSMIEHIALSHPNIKFTFIKDSKEVFITPNNNNLLDTIKVVLNKQAEEELISLNYKDNYLEIEGYISKPMYTKSNRTYQNFFINSRYINSRILNIALENAYKDFIMSSRYPSCVLNIKMHPSKFDINVHPSKMDVKFEDENKVYSIVYNSVKLELLSFSKKIDVSLFDSEKLVLKNIDSQENVNINHNKNIIVQNESKEYFYENKVDESKKLYLKSNDLIKDKISDFKLSYASSLTKNNKNYNNGDHKIHIIGEIFGTFIICEVNKEVLFIDKHAAHERIIYEKIKLQFKDDLESQVLLRPIIIDLSSNEYNIVLTNKDFIYKCGFMFEDFGNNTIIIREIPTFLKEEDAKDTFLEISNNLSYNLNKDISYDKLDWLYESISCRSAIKANDKNTEDEIIKLVNDIIDFNIIKYCPHGRPIVVKITKKDMEKIFGR